MARKAESFSNKLSFVRQVHESDEQTLERIINTAAKITCKDCDGTGRDVYINKTCKKCHGTGEKAYDPIVPIVEKVMNE